MKRTIAVLLCLCLLLAGAVPAAAAGKQNNAANTALLCVEDFLFQMTERLRGLFGCRDAEQPFPKAKVAAETTKNGRIGVMATKATISSGAYTRAIWDLSRSAEVFGVACPMLVPLVEEGWIHDEVTDTVLRRYLAPLFEEKIDTLILGCTHYPLLRSAIARVVGDDICLVNPAYETARALGELLANEGLDDPEKPRKDEPTPYRFFVSDEAERFTDFASMILPIDVKSARLIRIEKY